MRGQGGYAKTLWLAALRCKGYGVVMAGLRAGHARPLQTAVNGSRMKARPTEYGKVGCRAACPQAAADVCVNEKPCGLCCRGRRPRRPAEGSRPLPTMQRIKGVVMARLRAGHARPLQTAVNGSRTRGAREGGSPAPFPLTGCRGRLRAAYMPPLQRCCSPLRGFGGTPDSKVEEGPMALRTDSNTASV